MRRPAARPPRRQALHRRHRPAGLGDPDRPLRDHRPHGHARRRLDLRLLHPRAERRASPRCPRAGAAATASRCTAPPATATWAPPPARAASRPRVGHAPPAEDPSGRHASRRPGLSPSRAASPSPSSSTARAPLAAATRHGGSVTTRTTLRSASRKTASMGNRIPHVCTERAGTMRSGRGSRRPSRPRRRDHRVAARRMPLRGQISRTSAPIDSNGARMTSAHSHVSRRSASYTPAVCS